MSANQVRLFISLTILQLGIAPLQATEPSFMGLGDLPGGTYNSSAQDISADGSIVVGTGRAASGARAFRWTASEGMVALPLLSGSQWNSGLAASGDGLSLSGQSTHAFRWRTNGELIDLGHFAPPDNFGAFSWANALSFNGNVAVGASTYQQKPDDVWPFIWRSSTGLQNLGCLAGNHSGEATDVSADGSVVVGYCRLGIGTYPYGDAFRWTSSSGMTPLGTLPGGFTPFSSAYAISSDGSTIVGESSSAQGFQAFRWNGNVMTGLGDLPGGPSSSRAYDVSSDGSLVVGYSSTDLGDEAFLWDEANGMRNIRLMLESYGISLVGWRLDRANAISADGMTIVGYGRNPDGNYEGWIATLPEPGSICLLLLGVMLVYSRRIS